MKSALAMAELTKKAPKRPLNKNALIAPLADDSISTITIRIHPCMALGMCFFLLFEQLNRPFYKPSFELEKVTKLRAKHHLWLKKK